VYRDELAAVIFFEISGLGYVQMILINFLQKRNDLWCMTP